MPESQRVFVGATTKPLFFCDSTRTQNYMVLLSTQRSLILHDGFFLRSFDNVGMNKEQNDVTMKSQRLLDSTNDLQESD